MNDEEREDLNTFRHDLVKQARWWQWKAETLEKENEQLKAENAALRERLEKAVVFPIKFGDKIYTINFQKPKAQWSVHCGVVKTISVTQTPDKTQFVFRVKIKYRDAREYVLGKSAFLSKEAAESRLAELEGGKG